MTPAATTGGNDHASRTTDDPVVARGVRRVCDFGRNGPRYARQNVALLYRASRRACANAKNFPTIGRLEYPSARAARRDQDKPQASRIA